MLKIKDDVDLKELEKFGFVYSEEDISGEYDDGKKHIVCCYSMNLPIQTSKYNTSAVIDCEDRLINDDYIVNGEWVDFDLLYDLIQSGLVEKVVE